MPEHNLSISAKPFNVRSGGVTRQVLKSASCSCFRFAEYHDRLVSDGEIQVAWEEHIRQQEDLEKATYHSFGTAPHREENFIEHK